jgi:hypothetical protein
VENFGGKTLVEGSPKNRGNERRTFIMGLRAVFCENS